MHRTRLAAGENIIDNPGNVSTAISDFTTMKLHVNSSISDAKSRFVCMDVIDFYLNNMMYRVDYIMIKIAMITQEFVKDTYMQG